MRYIFTAVLSFFIFLMHLAHAQHYSPMLPNNAALFQSNISPNHIEALHVDSITSDSKGSAHHFIKTWDFNAGCRLPNKAVWSGSKCVVSGNTFYFFNDNEDTITIKATQAIGMPWILYTYPNGNYVEAQFSSKTLLAFLTVIDSVKTLSMKAKDNLGNNINSPLNTTHLVLSKNYGLIHFMDIKDFPNNIETYSLIGLSNPLLGEQILTPRTIFDYSLGDEFHYEKVYSTPPNGSYQKSKIINKITNVYRSSNDDTVIYTTSQAMNTYTRIFTTGVESNSYSTNNVIDKYIFNDTTYYPSQAIATKSTNSGYSYMKWFETYASYTLGYNSANQLSWNNGEDQVSYDQVNNCWNFLFFDPQVYASYIKGCGRVNLDLSAGVSLDYEKLVYYKKGNDTWGTPLTLSVKTSGTKDNMSIYPNPVGENQTVQLNTPNYKVKKAIMFNSQGMQVASFEAKNDKIDSFDLTGFKQGIYMLHLSNESGESMISRIVIE
jgi:hypothetical protein